MQRKNLSFCYDQDLANYNSLQNQKQSRELIHILLDLRNTMSHQQSLLDLLLKNEQHKYQQISQFQPEADTLETSKEEHDSSQDVKIEASDEEEVFMKLEASPEILETFQKIEENDEKKKPFKILRKNDFNKQSMEGNDNHIFQGPKRLSNKFIIPKCNPSKANHLWVNYGRKILDFALRQTKDEVHNRIKLLVGKLKCKRDFEAAFGLKSSDSEWGRQFKILFGKIALYFIESKAEEAFGDSKVKEQMICQKQIVYSFIKKLISRINDQ